MQHQSNIQVDDYEMKGDVVFCESEYEWKVQKVEDEMISIDKLYLKQSPLNLLHF